MPIKLLFLLVVFFLGFFAAKSQDSAISFLQVSKEDDLIIVGKIISNSSMSQTGMFLPQTMEVEVIEVLKGMAGVSRVVIKGADTTSSNKLAFLGPYQVGKTYVFSLKDLGLLSHGCHSLELANGKVYGNISNEPDKQYVKKLEKLFDSFVEAEKGRQKNQKRYEEARSKLHAHYELLSQTITYEDFKTMILEK
ncbi:hypothetical protein [Lacibacter sp. H407]|uniref:hypothetical protein n=1 Tax=Lacibacter sp. H407 TaxID=3133423 RepID=UPI0030C5FCD8